MTTKKVQKPGASRKTAAADEVTAERVRAFLADPDVKEGVKGKVKKLVGELYQAGEWDTLPDAPEMYMLEFAQTNINDHLARGTAEPDEREIYEKLAAAIDRSEPKDARTVRRLTEVLRDPMRLTAPAVILEALCDISNTTGANDLHPEIFPTLARVYIREARTMLADKGLEPFKRRLLRESVRKLAAVADAGR